MVTDPADSPAAAAGPVTAAVCQRVCAGLRSAAASAGVAYLRAWACQPGAWDTHAAANRSPARIAAARSDPLGAGPADWPLGAGAVECALGALGRAAAEGMRCGGCWFWVARTNRPATTTSRATTQTVRIRRRRDHNAHSQMGRIS